jgi:hypothetical protein
VDENGHDHPIHFVNEHSILQEITKVRQKDTIGFHNFVGI